MNIEHKKTPSGNKQSDTARAAEADQRDDAELTSLNVRMKVYSDAELTTFRERAAVEGGAFIDSLLKVLPEGQEADDMRALLTLNKLVFEMGGVAWDWRPTLKVYVLDALPQDPAEFRSWQRELHDKVSQLPDTKEYGDFWES